MDNKLSSESSEILLQDELQGEWLTNFFSCSLDVTHLFIRNLSELESTPLSQVVRTWNYGQLDQPITGHIVPEKYNKLHITTFY